MEDQTLQERLLKFYESQFAPQNPQVVPVCADYMSLTNNNVFSLKLIWLLFAATWSLWVAWTKKHLLEGKIFWTADFDKTKSWLWHRLMNLRSIARPFVHCQNNSSKNLIDYAGANGSRVLGLSTFSKVSDAILGDSWVLPRGRHRITQLIRACLPTNPHVLTPATSDVFLWRNNPDSEPGQFKASKT